MNHVLTHLFCAGDCGLGDLLGEQNENIYTLLVLLAKKETMAGVRSEPSMWMAGSGGCYGMQGGAGDRSDSWGGGLMKSPRDHLG